MTYRIYFIATLIGRSGRFLLLEFYPKFTTKRHRTDKRVLPHVAHGGYPLPVPALFILKHMCLCM